MISTEPILSAKGVNGQITLHQNRVEITRKGFTGFISHGFDGTKIIFISKLTGLQFKEPGAITNGYIQFIFPGSDENKGGLVDAAKDENTVMFNGKAKEEFERIRDYIFEQNS